MPDWLATAARFGLVGVLQNALNVASFTVLRVANIDYRSAAMIAGLLALALSFWLNRHWTFSGRQGAIERHVVKYTLVFAGAIAVGVLLLTFFVEVGGVPPVPAQVLAILAAAPASFLVQRAWVFAGEDATPLRR